MQWYAVFVATGKERIAAEEIEKKLLKAEKQIEDGKTINATEVFKELEEKYGF